MSNPQSETTNLAVAVDRSPSADIGNSGNSGRLYKAAIDGDWGTADEIFKSEPASITAVISPRGETALHLATSMGRIEFVKNLVPLLPLTALEKKNELSRTALHNAAIHGSLDLVKILVEKHRKLTQIPDSLGETPLSLAAYYQSKDVLSYLTSQTTNEPPGCPFTGSAASKIMDGLVHSNSYDICFQLLNLETYPDSAFDFKSGCFGLLRALTQRPFDFESGFKHNFWQRCIYRFLPEGIELDHTSPQLFHDVENPPANNLLTRSSTTCWASVGLWRNKIACKALEYIASCGAIKSIKDDKYKHRCTRKLVEMACKEISTIMSQSEIFNCFGRYYVLHNAVDNDTVEMVEIILEKFPYLVWLSIEEYGSILHQAVILRREKVLNLILAKNGIIKTICGTILSDDYRNILHNAARLSPYPEISSVSCPALQMQRELQWFKAVEEFVSFPLRLATDAHKLTPRELFTKEHKELMKDAEKWMKDTANSCMVVSALIATVVFAAAFTLPGGGNAETNWLFSFVVSDAIALFSSTTSVLMFMSITTARYAEEDFLRALPKRLLLGFASLFIAIASMMVAFGATLYLSLRMKSLVQINYILLFAVAGIPVTLFVMLQLPLFIYMVQSTYFPSIFRRKELW